jgi:multiple antibiotic resistance protein
MISSHLLPIVGFCAINPVLTTVVYANISRDLSIIQRVCAIMSSIILVFLFFLTCLNFGESCLTWLAIPSYVIQLGGGLLILIVGLGQMLASEQMVEIRTFIYKMTLFGQGKVNSVNLNSNVIFNNNKPHFLIFLFSPLALPLMINPVSILLMLFEGQNVNLVLNPNITKIILTICMLQALILLRANWVLRILGQIGLLTINRVVGLFLTIIALQMFVTGLKTVIPVIMNAT